MTHLSTDFPDRIALMAVRIENWGTETVQLDSGIDVRNQRWSAPVRRYEISMPPMRRDDADYVALRALYVEALGQTHSFDFLDFTDESEATIVPVRFASELQIVAIATHLDHIDTFTLVEDKSVVAS